MQDVSKVFTEIPSIFYQNHDLHDGGDTVSLCLDDALRRRDREVVPEGFLLASRSNPPHSGRFPQQLANFNTQLDRIPNSETRSPFKKQPADRTRNPGSKPALEPRRGATFTWILRMSHSTRLGTAKSICARELAKRSLFSEAAGSD